MADSKTADLQLSVVEQGLRHGLQSMRLRPAFVIKVWHYSSPSFRGSLAQRLIMHLLVVECTSWILHGCRRWRIKERVNSSDGAVG